MTLQCIVLHNVSRDMFFGFRPETSRLFHAHTFTLLDDEAEQTAQESAANVIWHLTNVGDEVELAQMRPMMATVYGTQVAAYRRRRNRSLSVGDVLIFRHVGTVPGIGENSVAGVAAVEAIGHEWLEFEPTYTDGSNDTEVSEAYKASEAFHKEVNGS